MVADVTRWAFDGHGRLFDLGGAAEVEAYGAPLAQGWTAAVDLPRVFGRRCALSGRTHVTYDLRCASEVFASNGGLYLNVVDEAQWYRWLDEPEASRPDRIPRATCIGARHLWVEVNGVSPRPV